MDEARERGEQFEGTVAATYTAATMGSGIPPELGSEGLRSYSGLQHSRVQALASQIATIVQYFPLHLRRRRRVWTKVSVESRPARITAVDGPGNVVDTVASHVEDRVRVAEQPSLSIGRQYHASGDIATNDIDTASVHTIPNRTRRFRLALDQAPNRHTCDTDSRPPLGLQNDNVEAILLRSDDGCCYMPLALKAPHDLFAVVEDNVIRNITDRIYYHKTNRQWYSSELETNRQQLQVSHAMLQGCVKSSIAKIRMALKTVDTFYRYLGLLIRAVEIPCAICIQEETDIVKGVTIRFPMCHRFLRGDDNLPEGISGQNLLIPPSVEDHGRSGNVRCELPARKPHSAIEGIAAQITIGVVVTGLVLVLIGWQSQQSTWFGAGDASLTQRVIILVWMCEGTIGTFLAFLSFREIMLMFAVFPFYVLLYQNSFVRLWPWGLLVTAYMLATATVLFTIFVPPIWGLAIVGQMLVEWGKCVTLYN